ncbi:uncharacterized protein LOC111621146 [Centruroides sculpturatus]|uniref:uncharacterized protein LOC111621146 n=1 Tax=Centruroides sculpturatus TaxID=218467 RepID=UPI000C6D1D40|nr:uncharacterized protein LOC111621146 [Centruroides sculpturatus]
MLRTLRDIKLQLPEGYAMIEPIKPDTLFKYYQWITTIAVALPGKLRIFAKIPLITPSGYFDMYEIVKFPTYIPTLKTFFQFKPEYPIIALSMDRQSYMLLQRFELTMCKIDHFPICSLNVPIQRFPQRSCEYALFNGIETQVKDLCTRQIVARYAPIFKRIDEQGTWIYSTSESLTLTIRCPTRPQKSPFISTTHKLNYTGIINLPNACTGYLPGIVLTSHFQRQSTLQLEIAQHLVVPQIEQLLNQTELQILQKRLLESQTQEKRNLNSDYDIKLADRSLSDVTYDLNHLLQMTTKSTPPSYLSTVMTIITSCLGTVVMGCCLYYIIRRYVQQKKRRPPPQPHPTEPEPEHISP